MTGPALRHVRVGDLTLGNDLPLVFIVGPNTLESRAHALEMSAALAEIAGKLGVGGADGEEKNAGVVLKILPAGDDQRRAVGLVGLLEREEDVMGKHAHG